MGGTCSVEVHDRMDIIFDSVIGSIKEPNKGESTDSNEAKVTEYIMIKMTEKPLYNPILPIKGDFDADIEVPENEVVIAEKGGLVAPADSMIRFPTNFKIEPVHFRKECTKESFLSRYSPGEIIGRGSFGVVKKIQDQETKAYRAVKIISKDKCQHTDNFVDEIEIIKKLVPSPLP